MLVAPLHLLYSGPILNYRYKSEVGKNSWIEIPGVIF